MFISNSIKNLDDFTDFGETKKVEKIFENGNATILHLVMKEGQGLPEHSTPIDAFLVLISGFAVLTMDGKEHALDPNDTIVLPAGMKHALWAKEDSKLLLFR